MFIFHFDRLKKLIAENELDADLKDELTETIVLLENDTKTFEDLEFQYLEEETEWLAYREEMHMEQKTLTRRLCEKRKHIQALETQSIDNQNVACADTQNIKKELCSMVNELEMYREQLKTIEVLLYELSGEKNVQSDSDEDFPSGGIVDVKRSQNDIMSQSLFGSQEIFNLKTPPSSSSIMSKSVNENLFSNKIEMLSFSLEQSTASSLLNGIENENEYQNHHFSNGTNEKRNSIASDKSNKSLTNKQQTSIEMSECMSEHESEMSIKSNDMPKADDDPLQKLKYNLSPPFEHKISPNANESMSANLNLSIESDDFEVNPLEKRVPSQDDIDRICKITTNAPISTHGASIKVIESIKEIERNRQLLLTQQGIYIGIFLSLSSFAHLFK